VGALASRSWLDVEAASWQEYRDVAPSTPRRLRTDVPKEPPWRIRTDEVVRLYLIETMAFRVLTPEAAVAFTHAEDKPSRRR